MSFHHPEQFKCLGHQVLKTRDPDRTRYYQVQILRHEVQGHPPTFAVQTAWSMDPPTDGKLHKPTDAKISIFATKKEAETFMKARLDLKRPAYKPWKPDVQKPKAFDPFDL